MHYATDKIINTTVVEHWLEREIALRQMEAVDNLEGLCNSPVFDGHSSELAGFRELVDFIRFFTR